MVPVRELDDDQVPGSAVFDDLDIAAMDDETPAKRRQSGVYLL